MVHLSKSNAEGSSLSSSGSSHSSKKVCWVQEEVLFTKEEKSARRLVKDTVTVRSSSRF